MTKDEMKLKAKVDEYFEKYMCVPFDKFIENWEETKELLNEERKINYMFASQCDTYKIQLQQKENIIKEVREKLNTQLAFTSSYQLNYQSAMSIIEEAKQILNKEIKNEI